MTDIVDRARALQSIHPEPQPFEAWREAVGVALAEADEIKRLRAELAEQKEIALRAAREAGAAARERDALRADAERYRWIFVHRLGWLSRLSPLPWNGQTKKQAVDAAIDAAMKA